MNLRCETCRYYDGADHECRVNPPVVIGGLAHGVWPAVRANDWCGEHEERTELPPYTLTVLTGETPETFFDNPVNPAR